MDVLLESIYQGILFTPLSEWIAVFAGVLYVIFAARQNMACWLFAFLSSAIYVWLCFVNLLYIESLLQVFYVIMAVYGWWEWTRQNNRTDEESHVRTWKWTNHLTFVFFGGVATLGLGLLFQTFTDQQNAYMDAFTTVFSLGATFMVTKRILENWIYWIIIDAISIYLYYTRGLQLTSLLFAFFTILAIIGFIRWYRDYKSKLAA